VAKSGVDVPSAINGSSDGKPPVASAAVAEAAAGGAPGTGRQRGETGEDLRRRHLVGIVACAMDDRLAREAVREDQRRRRIGIGQRVGTTMSGTPGSASCSIFENVGSRSRSS
jgi:hypothetical protein